MANQPKQEKRTCAWCSTRTRRWTRLPNGKALCMNCAPAQAETPQDAPQPDQAEHNLAQGENVPQAGAGEALGQYHAEQQYQPEGGRIIFSTRGTHEVRLGSVEQEFQIPLSAHEINQKGAQLSGAVKEIEQIEAEKIRAKREFCARLKVARQNVASLAQAVASGTVPEIRQAEVYLDRSAQRVNYRAPGTGVLYSSRDLEPGEQFQLPLEEAN
jgi:hypothetical protein